MENEKLVKELSLTWNEKLAKTEQKHVENKQALQSMGLANSLSGQDRSRYFLVNLNSDPSFNELLVYYLKAVTRVGTSESPVAQDIRLTGSGILAQHCLLMIEEEHLYLVPMVNAKCFVNGKEVKEKTEIWDGDRLLWGTLHFFRVNCPTKPGTHFERQFYLLKIYNILILYARHSMRLNFKYDSYFKYL